MSDENVFLDENDMFISNSRIAIGNKTYSTANISSVQTNTEQPSIGPDLAAIAIGALIMFGAWGSEGSVVGFLAGLAIAALGVLHMKFSKPEYQINFSASSGESNALKSKDKELVDKVVAAVNDAIVARG